MKNPASAEGFTVIFQKARDDKKTTGPGNARVGIPPAFRSTDDDGGYRPNSSPPRATSNTRRPSASRYAAIDHVGLRFDLFLFEMTFAGWFLCRRSGHSAPGVDFLASAAVFSDEADRNYSQLPHQKYS